MPFSEKSEDLSFFVNSIFAIIDGKEMVLGDGVSGPFSFWPYDPVP